MSIEEVVAVRTQVKGARESSGDLDRVAAAADRHVGARKARG